MKNIKITFFVLFTALMIVSVPITSLSGQSSKKEEKKTFKDHLWYGINVGNIGISNAYLNLGSSIMGGYKLNKYIKTGLIVHGQYYYQWTQGSTSNVSIFDYGFGGLINSRIYKNWFAHAEIDQWYIKKYFDSERNPYLFTYIGAGYNYASNSKWSGSVYLLYNVNPDTNTEFAPLDYRFAFIYNF